jgi:glutamate N-acetyltransferase/amino-acid N-acetyltransferase
VDTSCVLPSGFRTSGSTCGIKNSGQPDLALFISDEPAAAAGVFTTNRVVGAPVDLSRSRVPAAAVRAVVINSGNANACTGHAGQLAALQMTAQVAAELFDGNYRCTSPSGSDHCGHSEWRGYLCIR